MIVKFEIRKHGYAEFHTMMFVINDCDTSGVEWVSQ